MLIKRAAAIRTFHDPSFLPSFFSPWWYVAVDPSACSRGKEGRKIAWIDDDDNQIEKVELRKKKKDFWRANNNIHMAERDRLIMFFFFWDHPLILPYKIMSCIQVMFFLFSATLVHVLLQNCTIAQQSGYNSVLLYIIYL